MTTAIERLTKQRKFVMNYLGRRGTALLLLGFIFSCYGVSALIDPVNDQGHFSLYALTPPAVRVVLWIGASVIAVATLVRRDRRDWLAFSILSVPPTILIISHIVSYAGYLSGMTTYDGGLLRALQWVGILGLSSLIAGWPEVSAEEREPSTGELPEMRTQRALIIEEHREAPDAHR